MSYDDIYKELQSLKNEQVKLRRTLDDSLYNLDEDNFPSFSKTIKAVADNYENIALIHGEVDNQGATISQIVTSTVVGETTTYTANASFIISAINGQSATKINADLIQMTGTATFLTPESVGASGTTEIYGDRIKAGSLSSNNYAESGGIATAGMKLDLTNGIIKSKNFNLDSSGNVSLTGAISATSGSIGSAAATMPLLIGTDAITGNVYLWNRKPGMDSDTYPGVYIGTNGIALGSSGEYGVSKISMLGFISAPTIMSTNGSVQISYTAGGTTYTATIQIDHTTIDLNITSSAKINLYAANGVYANGVRVGG